MDKEESREEPLARFGKVVHDQTPGREILEISFARDGQVDDWSGCVEQAVKEVQPAALVTNFREAPAHELHDVFGAVIGPLVKYRDKDKAGLRPCAVVATDKKNKLLHKYLESAKLLPMLDIAYFEDVPRAVAHLQARLRESDSRT